MLLTVHLQFCCLDSAAVMQRACTAADAKETALESLPSHPGCSKRVQRSQAKYLFNQNLRNSQPLTLGLTLNACPLHCYGYCFPLTCWLKRSGPSGCNELDFQAKRVRCSKHLHTGRAL